MNLFWSTRLLTAAREDHLTEFFAAALDLSDEFRNAYVDFVLGEYFKTRKWDTPEIAAIRTQVKFEKSTCCPDMILELTNGKIIACEHKLDALETMGPERDQRPQLERYLDLPVDGVAYIRTMWNPPSTAVSNHTKYIRPIEREHFLWRDFYPLLPQGHHAVLDWLKEGFERLGFTPPHPSIGEMSGPDAETNQKNRQNFAKLWQRTRTVAHNLGWKVTTGSIVELYLEDNDKSIASSVFISPVKFDRFLFRITPQPGKLLIVKDRLKSALPHIKERTQLTSREIPRKNGKQMVIDTTTSLHEILGTAPLEPDEIEDRLVKFTAPLMHALQN